MKEIQQPSSLSGRDNYLAVITAPIIAFNHIHILYEHIALVGNMQVENNQSSRCFKIYETLCAAEKYNVFIMPLSE